MAKMKNAKKAFISSLLALTLSGTMVVGTTYAWFTDSVTSGSNVIQSGTLEVGMYWTAGKNDPDAETTAWKNAETGAIFSSTLWEPGKVEARHLKIVNEGSLAFKYKLLIVPNGEVSALADVIDVYFLEDARNVTRQDLANVTPVGTLADMINDQDGAIHGALLAKNETATSTYERAGEVTATIAFKMKETAGNEYQGLEIGSDFEIRLVAAQYMYEGDSFGNDYDADAEYPKFPTPVGTVEELEEVLNEGGMARLTKDLVVNEQIEMKGGVLDGNGYALKATTTATGKVLINPTGGTIKNLKIESPNANMFDDMYAIGSNQFAGTTLTEDLHIENVTVSGYAVAIDVNANGNSVYVSNSEIANWVQCANAEVAQFEGCHFVSDVASQMTFNQPNSVQSMLFLLGDMTFIDCHLEESVNFYLDNNRVSGTVTFTNSTYGNNGVENRPIDSFGFITWWMGATGVYGYAGTFGDTKPAQTNFSWIVNGETVWTATAI